MSARLRGLFGRWFAAALVLCLVATGAAVAAGPLAHGAAKPRRADLAVPSASAKLAAGRITVTIVASNRGRRSAPASTGAVTWKAAGGKAKRLKTFAVAALARGVRRSVKVTVAVPSGSTGSFAVAVCLDVNGKVRESSGNNNCRSAGTITVPAGGALGEQKSSPPVPTTTSTGTSSPASGSNGTAEPGGSLGGSGMSGDTTPPETSISRGPAGAINSRSQYIRFDSSEPGSTFECRLDGSNWVACPAAVTYTALAEGLHTFEVRATDIAGNTDPTPASRSWTVDATAPETTITAGPPAAVNLTSASLQFSMSENGSFECKLDAGAWSFCASPLDLTGLTPGSHTLQVRSTDTAGNTDASPATRTWTVDQTPPQTTIGSGPSGVTSGPSTSFGFSSEAGATFECRVDNGAWTACASPLQLAGLADGLHTFDVRAIDAAGNTDASPAMHSWTVDATAPDTSITGGPAATSGSSGATFQFSSVDAGATFECRLDAGAWGACTSPKAYAGLADGPHTFDVRAIDALGNVDPVPASQTWTADTTAPQTTIASGPSGTVASTNASFTFSSSEAGSSFECRLDGGAWGACTSPTAYTTLADEPHTFDVRATDAVGNVDQTPASQAWSVDATAPQTTITGGPPATVGTPAASFTFTSSEADSTFECRLDAGAWGACTSPKAYAGLADGPHTFDVRATDALGNLDQTPASQAWTVDTVAPQTTIALGPSGTVKTADASFAFSSEAGASFECSLDGAAFAACASPTAYTGLGEGPHTFAVRAEDALGNTDATPASKTWTVDTIAPDTTIGSGPSAPVASASASFTFSSSQPGSTFECRFDGGVYAACTSPQAYTSLADGPHTFDVRATDPAGNVDQTPASRAWTVDTAAPQTTIDGGPSGAVNSPAPSFSFSSSESGSSFECSLDGAAFAACSSPKAYGALADGSHTFAVRAKDAVGNGDLSPASRTWTVDTAAPDTTITGGPSGPVATASASFSFSSPDAGASFQCRIDGAVFAACTSPASYASLAEGSHTFDVRALDVEGNPDGSPASRAWTVDTVAPQTTIASGPSGTVKIADASFAFSSEAGASFECSLDGGTFAACTSPKTYTGVGEGPHTFAVRAKDALGNTDATPASQTWTVDTIAPDTVIDTGPTGTVSDPTAAFTFSSPDTSATFECRLDGGGFAACTSPATYGGLPDGQHTFDVQARDAAGNVDLTPASQSWTVATQP